MTTKPAKRSKPRPNARPDARMVALAILDQVLRAQRPLDETLERQADFDALAPRDRALVRQLVGTCLRRLGQIDAIIGQFLSRPAKKPDDIRLRHIIRLGAAQLLFLNVPDHAAVDTSVRLAVASGLAHARGVVNAVLRRIASFGPEMLAAQDAPHLNTPAWLWQEWVAAYGPEQARQIAAAHMIEPGLDITLRAPDNSTDWLTPLNAQMLPTGSLRRFDGGLIPELLGFQEGHWWIQDAAAAIPARLFGDVGGLKIADLCAAPGGKTAQLAAAGAHVVAVDRSEKRLERLRSNLKRLDLSAEVLAVDLDGDVTALLAQGPFDGILLDAPCSATGTIRRHPDVALLKRPEDIASLVAIQARLLRRACDWLKPGGLLIYCTCSLEPAEGEHQIAALLQDRTDMVRIPVPQNQISGLDGLVNGLGDIRCTPALWPDQGGLDGFFAARLRRVA